MPECIFQPLAQYLIEYEGQSPRGIQNAVDNLDIQIEEGRARVGFRGRMEVIVYFSPFSSVPDPVRGSKSPRNLKG